MNDKEAALVTARVRKLLTSDKRDQKDMRCDFGYCFDRRGNWSESYEGYSVEDKDTTNGHGAPGTNRVVLAVAVAVAVLAVAGRRAEAEADDILGTVGEKLPAVAGSPRGGSTASGNP